jgi:hypothetical protein
MLHSEESKFSTLQSRLDPRIRSKIRKYFRVFIRALGAIDLWKNWRSKISWDCLFKQKVASSLFGVYNEPDTNGT